MTDPDRLWTHLSHAQAQGQACVMCGRSTTGPGWKGVVVGRSEGGAPVFACSSSEQAPPSGEDWSRHLPTGTGPAPRTCADHAALIVPDTAEDATRG